MHNSNHKLVLTLAIFIASFSLLLIACSKLSSSTGEVKTNESTQYNNANFIYRDSLDGDLLYGYYQ